MDGIKILGVGHSCGDHLVKNEDFLHIDTSDEWIKSRTGIETRYIALNKSNSDMAYEAALEAINHAKIKLDDIRLVVTATMSPDNFTPSVSNEVIKKLDLKNAYGFDINVACSGFVFALDVCKNQLKEGYALVIGSEKLSKIIDWTDRSTCVLFGDSAGAFVIEKADAIYKSYLKSIPDTEDVLYARGVKSNPLFTNSKDYGYLQMNGPKTFKFAINSINEVVNNLECDVDILIPHQANKRIIAYFQNSKHIDNVYLNIDKYGNSSAASIPLAFYDAYKDGLFKKKKKVLLVGFGSGLAFGGVFLEVEL